MQIHEYQAKSIFKEFGIPVPEGEIATNLKQAMNITKLATTRTPNKLIADLADYKNANPSSKLSRLHFYAFGGIKKTSDWLKLVNDFPLDISANNEFQPIKY